MIATTGGPVDHAREVLGDRDRAQGIAKEMAHSDAPRTAARMLELLADTGEPVHSIPITPRGMMGPAQMTPARAGRLA